MKRLHAIALGVLGALLLAILLPLFTSAQPHGLRITRGQARLLADPVARQHGIEVDKAWTLVTWESSPLLDREFEHGAARRRQALLDPAVSPRFGSYRVTYFRIGHEKRPEYGFVLVGPTGEIVGVRRRSRNEAPGPKPAAEVLQHAADREAQSAPLPQGTVPTFESVRPMILSGRADHTFLYRLPSTVPTGEVVLYLAIYFEGTSPTGWQLVEEYRDGHAFRGEAAGGIASEFLRLVIVYALLLVLGVTFLKKYHAGEVGIATGALLFAVSAVLLAAFSASVAGPTSFGTGIGDTEARTVAWVQLGFKLLIFDFPLVMVIFLAWSVGESYARERWGSRLASFDALLRRDLVNATVGHSLLVGLLASPALAAIGFLAGLVPLLTGTCHPELGTPSRLVLMAATGPFTLVLFSAVVAIGVSVVAILFPLSWARSLKISWLRGALPLGFVLAAAIGTFIGGEFVPVGPETAQPFIGLAVPLAAAALFYIEDLLAAATALFSAALLAGTLPLLMAVSGGPAIGLLLNLALPLASILVLALLGLSTSREVSYRAEDLAPHVKRIIERERVKAEIDAANRIQAALLPSRDPSFAGATVASHYGAATEIGGDYFDFLSLPNGRLGLAFGDVAGHGLTSGIVMAMAKSALLVQVAHDSSPPRVLEVLNDIVMRTAPKRMLMTFFFGILDLTTGELDYSSAGHLDPYVFRSSTRTLEPLSAWGFPLGVKRRVPFARFTARLSPGDRLILYSDGLIEALDENDEPFGFDRFEKILTAEGRKPAEEIRKTLLTAIRRFTRNRPPDDDQTLVILAYDQEAAAKAA